MGHLGLRIPRLPFARPPPSHSRALLSGGRAVLRSSQEDAGSEAPGLTEGPGLRRLGSKGGAKKALAGGRWAPGAVGRRCVQGAVVLLGGGFRRPPAEGAMRLCSLCSPAYFFCAEGPCAIQRLLLIFL